MDSQVLAALLGALVGGLASGIAALGGSILVERMKLRKSVRIRMYEELLPPIRDRVFRYKGALSTNVRAEPAPAFLENVGNGADQLEHISVMAGRRDHRLASRIRAKVYEHGAQWADPDNWEGPMTNRKWVGDSDQVRALIEGIAKDVADLEARLRKKVD